MTQDEIIRMAREAGMDIDDEASGFGAIITAEPLDLERFAALVAAHEKKFWMEQIDVECNEAVLAEREACAKVCEEIAKRYQIAGMMVADECAEAIRGRIVK